MAKKLKVKDLAGLYPMTAEEYERLKKTIKENREAFNKDYEQRQEKIRKQLHEIRSQ